MKPLQSSKLFQRWESIDESWRIAIIIFVIARVFYTIWSMIIFSIQPVAIQNFELSGESIVSIFNVGASQAYIYSRQVNGNILSFQALNTRQIRDQQTNSIWNISDGVAIAGKYQGSKLARAGTTAEDIFPYFGVEHYPVVWLSTWQRFDANWYISIAQNGYGHIPGDVHFPPLFPVMMRAIKPLVGNLFIAGLLISHLATLLALKLLYDLFTQWGDATTAKQALSFFVLFPTSFFLFSAYTESIFLVTALLALRVMNARLWHWAGFWCFCAILIRLQGVALLVPLLFLMWHDRPFLQKFSHWFGWIVASAAGFLYLYLRSQQVAENTLPFVETNLHARLIPPWEHYLYSVKIVFSGNATFIDILNLLAATLFFVLLAWGWKKIPVEYNIYSLASLLIIMTREVETQPLMSMSRYSLTLFSSFYVLSLTENHPVVRRVIVYSSVLLNLYLSAQFFLWGWVA